MPTIKFETDTQQRGTLDTSVMPYAIMLEGWEKPTQNFSFISPAMEEIVNHFIISEDTDMLVSIKAADTISAAFSEPSRLAVRFTHTGTLMALGQLDSNFIPEIGSVLVATPNQSVKATFPGSPESVWNVDGIQTLGKIVYIDSREEA